MPGTGPGSSSGEDGRVQGSTVHRLGTPLLDEPKEDGFAGTDRGPICAYAPSRSIHRSRETRNFPVCILTLP